MLRWVLAVLHLLALPLGLGAIWLRGRGLAAVRTPADLPPVFRADNVWGLAAALWIATGVWRLLAGLEQPTSYYLHDRMFYAKMALFLVILLLELWPMITLIRWRAAAHQGRPVILTTAPTLARISQVEAGLVVLIVFAAAAVARGFLY